MHNVTYTFVCGRPFSATWTRCDAFVSHQSPSPATQCTVKHISPHISTLILHYTTCFESLGTMKLFCLFKIRMFVTWLKINKGTTAFSINEQFATIFDNKQCIQNCICISNRKEPTSAYTWSNLSNSCGIIRIKCKQKDVQNQTKNCSCKRWNKCVKFNCFWYNASKLKRKSYINRLKCQQTKISFEFLPFQESYEVNISSGIPSSSKNCVYFKNPIENIVTSQIKHKHFN